MDKFISADSSVMKVRSLFRDACKGDVFVCDDEYIFQTAKTALVAEKVTGVTVQLLDPSGYVVKQVSSKLRTEQKRNEQFNDRQLAVISALEKVLAHCKKEGIQLIGFSDELVAQPAHLDLRQGVSPFALDLDTQGVYCGAESLGEMN